MPKARLTRTRRLTDNYSDAPLRTESVEGNLSFYETPAGEQGVSIIARSLTSEASARLVSTSPITCILERDASGRPTLFQTENTEYRLEWL